MILVQDTKVHKFHIIHDALAEVSFQESATFIVEAS